MPLTYDQVRRLERGDRITLRGRTHVVYHNVPAAQLVTVNSGTSCIRYSVLRAELESTWKQGSPGWKCSNCGRANIYHDQKTGACPGPDDHRPKVK